MHAMQTLLVNSIGRAVQRTLHGREYLVVNMTLIVEGVLNGSRGPLLYLRNEYQDADVWNNMPLVVRHPMRNGRPVSARRPDVINESGIGFIFEAKATPANLQAQGWFDVEATKRVDMRIYNALINGEPIELSTGLKADYRKASKGAVWNSEKYTHVVENIRPDHVAVLPDEIGACSLRDGCGVNVTTNSGKRNKQAPVVNEVQTETVTREVSSLADLVINEAEGEKLSGMDLKEKDGKQVIEARISRPVNNNRSMMQFFKEMLGIGDGSSKVKVKKEKTVTNTELTAKQRKKLVNDLVANCDCWDLDDEEDVEMIENMSDEKLKMLVEHAKDENENRTIANAAKRGFKDTAGAAVSWNSQTNSWNAIPPKGSKGKTKKPVNNTEDDDEEDDDEGETSNLSKKDQRLLNWAKEQEKTTREKLTKAIIANAEKSKRKSLAEKLEDWSIDQLETYAEGILGNSDDEPDDSEEEADDDDDLSADDFDLNNKRGKKSKGRNYSGAAVPPQGGGTGRTNKRTSNRRLSKEEAEVCLTPPVMNFDPDGSFQRRLLGASSHTDN